MELIKLCTNLQCLRVQLTYRHIYEMDFVCRYARAHVFVCMSVLWHRDS